MFLTGAGRGLELVPLGYDIHEGFGRMLLGDGYLFWSDGALFSPNGELKGGLTCYMELLKRALPTLRLPCLDPAYDNFGGLSLNLFWRVGTVTAAILAPFPPASQTPDSSRRDGVPAPCKHCCLPHSLCRGYF